MAVKFLMARKFDCQRALELYLNHEVRTLYYIEDSAWFCGNPVASPTAIESNSAIVRQSYRLHEYELRGISKFLLFSLK